MNDTRWDPQQYLGHADPRSRPFHDLVQRVPLTAPQRVVDLGCGPGNVTATLAQRWPDAHITGLDSSPAMIEAALPLAASTPLGTGRLDFRLADISGYVPEHDGVVDLLLSNAALQWVPNHFQLLPGWFEALPSHGVLAFQVPRNFDEPNHTLLTALRNSSRWRSQLGDAANVAEFVPAVRQPIEYLDLFASRGVHTDVWEGIYYHVLSGATPVLEWMMGTGLRPVLSVLTEPAEREEFLASYQADLAQAYPAAPYGTVLPYRRIFVVASKK
ncbi:methyltransferase domain-containing protein [Streptomyces sp. N35]|uniref:methyltransferase domain-containing protein n=1 Tax=Streptomyces sp. N35 TaxID=2795730 RepID=UPI0018F29320|nr:methyltransferase domain-containing protein [Streptomyces sp. N35]